MNYFNIDNRKKWTPNQPIKIISEGPCDIKDWSNDFKL